MMDILDKIDHTLEWNERWLRMLKAWMTGM